MANWKYKIDIKKEWDDASEGNITIQGLARTIASRLKQLPIYIDESDDDLWSIVDEFECFSEDEESEVGEFDFIIERLYDWADTPLDSKWNGSKMCWIATI